ncbi:MAG: hypothetical protein ACC700_14710 [Anaerolineales bacterium]
MNRPPGRTLITTVDENYRSRRTYSKHIQQSIGRTIIELAAQVRPRIYDRLCQLNELADLDGTDSSSDRFRIG